MWQTWTAFGIMIGYVMDVAFQDVRDPPHITGLNWRLMLGSVRFPSYFPMFSELTCMVLLGWCSGVVHRFAGVLVPRVASVADDEGPILAGIPLTPAIAPD